MRALLAEDDAILADALGTNLKSAGFEVEVADNGAVAEYLLTKQAFDVGIIDIGLPLVDGLTVVQRVRAIQHTYQTYYLLFSLLLLLDLYMQNLLLVCTL